MNDIAKKLKNLNITKKNLILIIVGILALLILAFGEIVGSVPKKTESSNAPSAINAELFTEKAEKDLEKLLGGIKGAGKVRVMVTLESRYENVYAKGYETENDKTEKNEKSKMKEEYIIVENGTKGEDCLIVKIYEPSVKGVAVVAQGADNIAVKKAITETVCALYNISSAKVSVTKMNG